MKLFTKKKIMKFYFIITLSIFIGFFSVSNAFAIDKSDCIYGSKIDQSISFYQRRLYLLDSEYKILSDIGKDAIQMINYLQGEKDQLIEEMIDKEIEFKSGKISAYIINYARIADVDLGYTKP